MKPPFDIAADLDTPVSAYMKLKPFRPRFLLESVEGGERLARYSFIGFGDCLEVRLDAKGLRIGNKQLPIPANQTELLNALRNALLQAPLPTPSIPGVPLIGGLVGVAGFDLVRYFERLPSRHPVDPSQPDAHYFAPQSILVFDHLTRSMALLHAGSDAERQSLRKEVIQALRGGLKLTDKPARYSEPVASLNEAEYIANVKRTQEYIAAGDVYQLVLASRFSGECELDPFQTYRALRLLNPSPYMYYCDLGDHVIAGSSPEALVKMHNRQAQLRPIAGTLPRGADNEQDLAFEKQLLADPKENAEHVMLVDLARNDLGRVAKAGSVHVNPYRVIERYSHVMHIVSGVQGELAADKDAFDLFAAAFPAGTLVGSPKVRAMQIIDELEPCRRGFYGGTIGYFGKAGSDLQSTTIDQAITIRTLVFSGDKYSFQAGAGIVSDSVPEKEYQEVLAKSAILRRALQLTQEGL
ncbi:MAG TPA: anthranilate synthase component I family protein [Steroidobacteraceae bacterium]|nr:anthranilate synthase component I family protein [Steroidobacteraceae bacterium]